MSSKKRRLDPPGDLDPSESSRATIAEVSAPAPPAPAPPRPLEIYPDQAADLLLRAAALERTILDYGLGRVVWDDVLYWWTNLLAPLRALLSAEAGALHPSPPESPSPPQEAAGAASPDAPELEP